MLILQEPRPLPVHTLAFSPDGRTLASVNGRNFAVTLWDLQARQPSATLAGHGHRVVSVAFAPSGEQLASVCSAGEVRVWEPSGTGRWQSRLLRSWPREGEHAPGRLAFSPDGGLLATNFLTPVSGGALPAWLRRRPTAPRPAWFPLHGSGCRHLQVLRLSDGKVQGLVVCPGDEVSSLAFSPDGLWLALGSFDRTVQVRRLDSDEGLVLNQGKKVHYLAFSPDGRTLASGTPGGLVKLWDATTGHKRTTLKGQAQPLHALCYSPDGRVVATAGGEGTVCFWDVATGGSRTAFDWGVGEVHAVAFAPDGMRAAAGGLGKIVVWDIDDWDM